ncbi:transcriptional regulator, partial [Dietzia sp. UCD-THP]
VGRGPQSFKVGRKVYYRRSVVEQWITDREAESVLGV